MECLTPRRLVPFILLFIMSILSKQFVVPQSHL